MATSRRSNYVEIDRLVIPKSIVGKKHYMYIHYREDKSEPFYVGVGTMYGKYYYRALCKKKRNNLWFKIANKTKYTVFITHEADNKEEILDREIQYIKLWGKISNDTGTLANLTDGGEGMLGHKVIWTEEMKDKIRKANRERIIN